MKTKMLFYILSAVILGAIADESGTHFRLSKKPCDLDKDLPKTFSDIKAFMAKPVQSEKEAERLWGEMEYIHACINNTINNEASFFTNSMPGMNNAARCEGVEKVANLLQPYNGWLLEIEFGDKNSTNQRVLSSVGNLLGYTKPDEVFRSTLEKKARESSGAAWSAFYWLDHHELFGQPMKDLLKEYVINQKSPEDKKRWAMSAASMGIGEYAIPYCEQLLSQPFKPDGLIGQDGYGQENELTGDYQIACDTLGYIGTNACRLLPLLKKRQAEAVAAKDVNAANPFIRARFYTAIQCLEGTQPVTVSGKSPYCMWCK
jgi:hypothetical protein